jgi:hypothetical protein
LSSLKNAVAMFAFLRQALHQERGIWREKGVSLHVYSLPEGAVPLELDSGQRAELVRILQGVARIKDPIGYATPTNITESEDLLMQELRRPSEEEIANGVRYAVWPIAAIVLMP